ncbi:MAG: hypothetical protein AABY22_25595 [Nanoarchaeota archaeon]
MKKYLILFSLFLPFLTYSKEIIQIPDKFFKILGTIESNNNDLAVGDRGKALGRYQIWQIYFKDAQNFDKSLQNIEYKQVTNEIIARQVINSYMNKYCLNAVKSGNYEVMVRTHNGGPDGQNKQITLRYWQRFKKLLDK